MKCISTFFAFILLFTLTSTFTASFAQLPWTKYANNPVMTGGASGTWNRHVFSPMVLYNPDSIRFEMWYGATDGPPNWEPYQIGFATSIDGINWTKLDSAVLKPDPGMWDETLVLFPHVIRENGEYKMWYTGWSPSDEKAKIGYATSQNGIIWTKYSANPVMTPGTATWEVGGPHYGYVMVVPGGDYKMWYTGYNVDYSKAEIGYATSSDGITWARADSVNPVLTTGSPGCWDDAELWAPCILFINNTYHMWYSGMRASSDPRWTGWATSVDCIHWNKYNDPNTTSTLYIDSDPVLKPSSGQWDENFAQVGTVMIEGDSLLRMWYQGARAPSGTYLWKIGHATAPIVINVPGDVPTIQAGIDSASDGNIVLVEDGTYYENINFKGKAITVASRFLVDGDSSHIDNTIIDGSQPSNPDSGSVVYFICGEDTNSVLYGFTIENGSGTVIPSYNERSGGGIFMFPSGGRISHNKILNNSIITSVNYITGAGILAAPVANYVIIEHNDIHSNTGTLQSNGNSAGGGIGIIGNNGESRIINNKIYNNTIINQGSGGTLGGGIFCGDESSGISLIKDNIIKDNICQPTQTHSQNGGAGIRFYNMSGKLINNKIMNNSFIGNRGGGGGVLVSTASSVEIINNIIFGNFANRGGAIYNSGTVDIISNSISMNKSMSAGGGIYSTNPIPIIMNTIFWSDSTGNNLNEIFLVSGGSTPVAYSNIDSSGVVGSWNSINNIDADPLFADSLFHLSDSSLCIGAGIDSIQIGGTWYYCPPYDIYGNPRPDLQGSMPDIGACESPLDTPIVTGIQISELDNIPKTHSLSQNYPNPFNPVTTIEFDLPKMSEVTLKVFNILGEEVATLVSDRLSTGSYSYEWDASDLASGVYLYRLQAADYVETRKMVLMK